MGLRYTQQTYKKTAGYQVISSQPFDNRLIVNEIKDLCYDTFCLDGAPLYYEGMVVSVLENNGLYMLADESKMLSTSSACEGSGWVKLNAPEISTTGNDEGKLLTVVKHTIPPTEPGGLETYRYEAQWVEAPSGLPDVVDGSVGKVLTVSSDGTPEWKDIPTELPAYTEEDSGKVLAVSSDGTSTEWTTVDTSLMEKVTTEGLFDIATRGGLKPGMKYRITDYNPNIDANYVRKINGGMSNIASSEVKFDIIVTASSESTLFDDVELVAKNPGPGATFDYTKYEAKYDLVGNRDGLKYDYLQSSAAGVIYYMKDQFGNEASYDFENIVYVGIVHGAIIHTFSGVKNGDLRASGLIQNVRIKHHPSDLPGVIFMTTSRYGRMFINNVELDNCNGVYFEDTNLRHAKISNSTGINFIMTTTGEQQFCPLFENLNICNNETLTINCSSEFNGAFEELNGLHINNLNILPSFTSKLINIADLLSQTSEIVVQGLNDSNIVSKLNIKPETGGWILALLEQNPIAYRLIFGRSESARINLADVKWDVFIYDSILNASKNIKPFDIFNPSNGDGSVKDYSLEIPQFQSTATSVVELGI
jgi:hypothetical protein